MHLQARYPFARIQSLEALEHPLGQRVETLHHLAETASARYFVARRLLKEDGTERVLFDVRPPLKGVLKRINIHFLSRVQYPPYLTGGVPKKDYKSSADLHAGGAVLVKEDITKFYPSVKKDVVFGIWAEFFGFAPEVAALLTELTIRDGHLEQGAPTSGYLANLALWDVEPRAVAKLHALGFTRYSRHVDDIAFSSKTRVEKSALSEAVSVVYGMLAHKGLRPNRRKHRVLDSSQPMTVLKLVANQKASLPAKERRRVRAVVHQFVTRAEVSPSSPEVQAELPKVRGQAYKVKRFHPTRGEKLVEQIAQAVKGKP